MWKDSFKIHNGTTNYYTVENRYKRATITGHTHWVKENTPPNASSIPCCVLCCCYSKRLNLREQNYFFKIHSVDHFFEKASVAPKMSFHVS